MNLAIDIGNSLLKAAVFEDGMVVENFKSKPDDKGLIDSILEIYPKIDSSILVSSRGDDMGLSEYIRTRTGHCMRFGPGVPVPIKNLYGTPETLGCDRLAAAVGAASLYPASNILIVDFGTAITIDVVSSEGEFLGGNISPGANSRFRALHDYTGRLPLLSLAEHEGLIGKSSAEAITGGVVNGIMLEIEGYISRLSVIYPGLRIIFTGGDSEYFAKRTKNTIFATYDLVVYGLNRILEYNADQKSNH